MSARVARRIKSKRNAEIIARYYDDDPSWPGVYDSYHDQWWGYAGVNAVTGVGVHGQFIYINSDAEVVIAKHSSDSEAEGIRESETAFIMNAIASALSETEN